MYANIFVFLRQGFSVALGPVLEASSCIPGCLQTYRDPPAFRSQVLGLKACATTA